MATEVIIQNDCRNIDWKSVRDLYRVSSFDNGRRPDELKCAFDHSYSVCFALSEAGDVVGTARAISDTISCAFHFRCLCPSRFSQAGHRKVDDEVYFEHPRLPAHFIDYNGSGFLSKMRF